MILDDLAAGARKRVEAAKAKKPLEAIRDEALSLPATTPTFRAALAKKEMAFICEVKRASPSNGLIAADFPYLAIAADYADAGADALSVLTEPFYFQGSDMYLAEIVAAVSLPTIRKDFVVDAYQLYEARLLGASAVLLICALLDAAMLRSYVALAGRLGLDALVETHDEREMAMARDAGATLVGINNRNLRDFTVDLRVTERLRPLAPTGAVVVAESGLHTASDVRRVREAGADAALIGEALMRSGDKHATLAAFRDGAREAICG
jgi:indole-3-glycerol phosphate synthase